MQEKTDQPTEDTNHITRLKLDGLLDGLSTSESMPLLTDESSITSRCTSSLSMDQLSTITAITTTYDASTEEYSLDTLKTSSDEEQIKKLTVQNLIVISKDPSPDLRSRVRPRPKPRLSNNVDVDSSDDEDDEDSDEVTDYLEKLNIEVSNIDMNLEDQVRICHSRFATTEALSLYQHQKSNKFLKSDHFFIVLKAGNSQVSLFINIIYCYHSSVMLKRK